jgi:hypothetical protein
MAVLVTAFLGIQEEREAGIGIKRVDPHLREYDASNNRFVIDLNSYKRS